jgi:hypothetical protein
LIAKTFLFGTIAFAAGCSSGGESNNTAGLPSSMSEVPAVRLNYRYEADVPAPPQPAAKTQSEERVAAVQTHFDQNRPQEVLDKSITSPDGKRVIAVYHLAGDLPSEFRLDMYSPDGALLNRVTADVMAVHFPDTIRWSPDSTTAAFVAMVRGASAAPPAPDGSAQNPQSGTAPVNAVPDANEAAPADANTAEPSANVDTNTAPAAPTPAAPTGILTFRTEQIYLCDANGTGVKPVTQNEGLIYFYYVWSPDSTMLAALAATAREWAVLNQRADLASEMFVPVGRPRLIEKNGRERRLDDALTAVQPVWSPDSSKVAAGFDTQVRIYDAPGTAPTQAAIPLRNALLISSQAYDREQQSKLNAANIPTDENANTNSALNPAPQPNTLPDPSTLVSFNPIVALAWPSDSELYFQTAFIKRMKNEADSVNSFQRWHRLILSPQPAANH